MWNDEPNPAASTIDLLSTDEVALWTYMLGIYSSAYRDDPIAWSRDRDFAIRQADECVLAYRQRMRNAGPGTPTFVQQWQAEQYRRAS